MANLELNKPITPETIFPIASISKSFTAMSALLGSERGELSLDDEVQKYIPDWADRDGHITIRHLLTHTSGLRDAFTLLGWAAPSESAGDQNQDIVRMLSRQRGLNFPPGTEYQYNNGGYNLLASLVQRATGQSLPAFADANIFKPLEMMHSSFPDDTATLGQNSALRYSRQLDGWHRVKDSPGPAIVGNAGMYSTVDDLLRWVENFETTRVGTRDTLAAMQKPTVLKDGTSTPHGLGFALGQYRGAATVETSGADRGTASEVARFPGQRFAVAVLCNEDSVVMGGLARVNPDIFINGIADIYLGDVLEPTGVLTQNVPSQKPVKLSDTELSEASGLYRYVSRDWPVLMTVSHGMLMLRSYYQDDSDLELMPIGGNRFLLEGSVPLEFIPARGDRSKEWHEGSDARVWQPVMFALQAAALPSYTGKYRSDELGVTYTLDARDTALVVQAAGRPPVTIAPFSKDVFVGDGVGIMKFTRDQGGAVTGMTVNRDAARGVRFDRVK
jgi:CubicO group peptidase (beta-lactamase class C family)